MKNRLILVIIILAMTALYGCKNTQVQSQWSNNSIKIDGIDSDWQGMPLLYSEDLNASIGLTNDEEYLYHNI